MEKVRVQLHKQTGFETFERGATKGATVGVNLFNADGSLLDLTQYLGNQAVSGDWAPLNGTGAYGTWNISVSGTAGSVLDQNGGAPLKLWEGSQSEYDALGTYDSRTFYFIPP